MCDGIYSKSLEEVNAATSAAGLITSCKTNHTKSSDSTICFRCQPGFFLPSEISGCTQCTGQVLCTGDGNSSFCPERAVCADGIVIRCEDFSFVLNSYKTACVSALSQGGAESNG